jgi:hypothetical protein
MDPKKFYRKEAVINVKNMPKQIAVRNGATVV